VAGTAPGIGEVMVAPVAGRAASAGVASGPPFDR